MSRAEENSIARYVEAHASPVPPLLEELERETRERTSAPGMLSGRVEGQLLGLLVRLAGARQVIEIGTFTGYSTLLMAEALPAGGMIITCEIDEAHAAIARRYFARSPHADKIALRLGPALDTLRELKPQSVDLVFIDADKEGYPSYYTESFRVLRSGGMIVADNALWGGSVLHPDDSESEAIARFNDMVMADGRVDKVLLPVRDGVYLVRKR